jgi:hypothetical protein
MINEHDQFKQIIGEHRQNPSNSTLFEQIDQWEKISIEKIKRTAEGHREMAMKEIRRIIDQIERELVPFTNELEHVREENEVNEIDLRQLNKKLTEIKEELIKPSKITIEEDSSQTFIHNIHLSLPIPNYKQGQMLIRSSSGSH